jgi:hypothetical protein
MATMVRAIRMAAPRPNGEVMDAPPPTGGTGATDVLDADADAELEVDGRLLVVRVVAEVVEDPEDVTLRVLRSLRVLRMMTELVDDVTEGVATLLLITGVTPYVVCPTGIGTMTVLPPIMTLVEPAVPIAAAAD